MFLKFPSQHIMRLVRSPLPHSFQATHRKSHFLFVVSHHEDDNGNIKPIKFIHLSSIKYKKLVN